MKKNPIGIQTFQEIIVNNYVYADKTQLVHNLVTEGKVYFLSRPRRFGKSLLLSTFKALFQGPVDPDGPPQGLFKDLWIGQSDYDFSQTYPVITFSMSDDSTTSEDLKESILKKLRAINAFYGLGLEISLPGTDVFLLIQKLSQTLKKKVVVLIDEYDAPVSDHIGNLELAQKNRDVLKSFYSGFKNTDEYLRFVFVTGVTRYAFMGLSAGFNHLNDITLSDKFAAICGFTHDELDSCFNDYMSAVLDIFKSKGKMSPNASVSDIRKDILRWYDGYSWDGEIRVLNPWSILKFFYESSFSDYWVRTNPSLFFLTNLTKGNLFNLLKDKFGSFSEKALGLAEVGGLTPIAGLFQTGYLTVDKVFEYSKSKKSFSLKIPNFELQDNQFDAFSEELFKFIKQDPQEAKDNFINALKDRDAKKLTEILNSLFGGLDAIHHEENESCYHKILYGYCKNYDGITITEYHGAVGNPDLVTIFPVDNWCVLIELKFSSDISALNPEKSLTTLAQNALKAIDTKDYAVPWKAAAQELIKIGIGVTIKGKCVALIGD
jgi:hypothetical protein